MYGKWCLTTSLLCIVGLLLSCSPAAPAAIPKSSVQGPTEVASVAKPTPAGPTPTSKTAEGQPRYGGTLIAAIKNVTPHFDMVQETAGNVQIPLAPSYNLLIRHDPLNEFKIGSDLAKGWEASADGLTYTFHLNEGVKFHNGRLLTAEDIKFNFERTISPPKGTLSPRRELFRNILRIEAPDVTTLRITLKDRQASFLGLMALPTNFIFDPEVIKKKGDMKRDVMGTGPFKFVDAVHGVSFRAQRNSDYFVKGRPYLDGYVYYIIQDEMTRSAAMRTKQLTILPLFGAVSTWLSLQMQKAQPSIVLQKRVTPGPNSLIPNTKVNLWSDVRVRRALNLAIDRETGSKAIRDFQPGYGYVVPGSGWELPKEELMAMPGYRQPKDQDVAEAKRLLAEAGYPQGFETSLATTFTIYNREHAEFAQAQLGKIGIKLNIELMESPVWKARAYEGAFSLGVQADASASDDPDIVLGEYYLTGSPKNYGGWSNEKVDDLYALQSKTIDTAKRKEVVWDMQRLLHQEVPRVVTVWSTFYAASWPEVKDWYQGRSFFLGNQLQDVWLAK